MVQDFFEDSAAWMSIPENMVVLRDGKPALAKEGTAVPARERFDKLMQSVVPDTLALSIEKTFEAINETGTDYTTFAQAVVEKLVQASGIMLRANIDGSNFNRYLMYPSSLKLSSDGIQIANALETAAKNAFPGIQVYASEDAESIKQSLRRTVRGAPSGRRGTPEPLAAAGRPRSARLGKQLYGAL